MTVDMFDLFDATYGNGIYEAIPDGAGGADIFHNGTVVDHMNSDGVFDSQDSAFGVPNVEGGKDIISPEGQVSAHTQPNVLGGTDVYSDDGLEKTTIPNVEGGFDIYNADLNLEGKTIPNSLGGEDYIVMRDNSNEIMSYDDPLRHSSEYHMDSLSF